MKLKRNKERGEVKYNQGGGGGCGGGDGGGDGGVGGYQREERQLMFVGRMNWVIKLINRVRKSLFHDFQHKRDYLKEEIMN